MTDVYLQIENGEPDILTDGDGIVMTDGLETAVILSWFGGNASDDGSEAHDAQQWWGNRGETDEARHQRSRLQFALENLPATSANLRRLEEAAAEDLEWLSDDLDSVAVAITLVAPKRVEIVANLAVNGESIQVRSPSRWGAS